MPQPAMTTSNTLATPPVALLRRLGAACLAALLAGCAVGPEPTGPRPDPASIRKIGFRIVPDHLGAAGEPHLRQSMAEQVAKNLASWGYPIEVEAGGAGYSHLMAAKVGEVSHKSTPAGFSMSMGNSDPRALEFQKADVLPVDCELWPAGGAAKQASLYMDFVAGDKLKNAGDAAKADPAIVGAYVEHLATVCFNLLDDLRVPRRKPAAAITGTAAASTPSWMPEVRIEVRDQPAEAVAAPAVKPVPAAASGAVVTPPAPAPAVVVPATPAPAPAGAKPVLVPAPTSSAPPATAEPAAPAPAVTTETRVNQDEGRKQMIIHNLGSPIILEFGYERK